MAANGQSKPASVPTDPSFQNMVNTMQLALRKTDLSKVRKSGHPIADHDYCVATLDRLTKREAVEIAVDTEFYETQTLTVQAAILRKRAIQVQVYHSKTTPVPPADLRLDDYVSAAGHELRLNPAKRITRELSPARMLQDLLGLSGVRLLDRSDTMQLLSKCPAAEAPANATWNEKRSQWDLPRIRVRMLAHFLTADLGRMFGTDFSSSLFAPSHQGCGQLYLPDRKLLTIATSGGSFLPPVVEAIETPDGHAYLIELEFADTMLPFGGGSLDRLCQTFLGAGKSEAISQSEKENMLSTFQRRTADAYGYAISDVINELLLYQQMKRHHREVFRAFGVPKQATPPMRPTLGRRTSDFIQAMVQQTAAAGSQRLASERELKALIRMGGPRPFGGSHPTSRFGQQTATTHGGLLFSRTSTRFWHEAPGQLRDVDMQGCYNRITSQINVYLGRPVVWEPGDCRMTLREAVERVEQLAPSDGWFIRVTGEIQAIPNVLIPSTLNAVTHTNIRQRTRRARLAGPPIEQREDADENAGAKLFSGVVESGIVTWATWTMIQTLPESARLDYENLVVESIVMYPKNMIADNGPHYDRLVAEVQADGVSWRQDFDIEARKIVQTEELDHEYVSLRFPVSQVANRIGELRKQAKEEYGKGSGADLTWKLQANTIYGVLAGRHQAMNNVVAANVVTAHARAEAFAMMLGLNGLQVITDGCSYRRDRIPACTFQECLEIMPDYPLRHADAQSGIPFVDPATIPDDDAEFSVWLVQHLRRFFETNGSDQKKLFSTHHLEHKRAGSDNSPAFDALACDGSANYIKLVKNSAGDWQVVETKMRGHRRMSKAILEPWLLDTYSSDRLTELPPITADDDILKLKPCKAKARKLLDAGGAGAVLLPLGFTTQTVQAYQPVKLSAFVFQTPKQYAAVKRQLDRFRTATACGLELMVLRRKHGGRRTGSLQELAQGLYDELSAGRHDIAKWLNLRPKRLSRRLRKIVRRRRRELGDRKAEFEKDLHRRMVVHDPDSLVTGIVVTRDNRKLVD